MEVVGSLASVLGMIGALNQAVRIGNELRNRYKSMKKLPKLCEDLEKRANAIYRRLEPFKQPSAELPLEVQEYFKETEERFKDADEKLDHLKKSAQPSSSSKAKRLRTFTNELETELESLVGLCDLLYDRLLSLSSCQVITNEVGRVEETVVEVKDKVVEVGDFVGTVGDKLDQGISELTAKADKLDRDIKELDRDIKELSERVAGGASHQADRFEPSFQVPTNPVGVSLSLDDAKAWEITKQILGETHSNTAEKLANLALSGKTQECREEPEQINSPTRTLGLPRQASRTFLCHEEQRVGGSVSEIVHVSDTPVPTEVEAKKPELFKLASSSLETVADDEITNRNFLRAAALALQYSLMEQGAKHKNMGSCTVSVESEIPDGIEPCVTLDYSKPRETVSWVRRTAQHCTASSKLVVDGHPLDIEGLVEDCLASCNTRRRAENSITSNLFRRVLALLLNAPVYLGDCTSVIYANGLVGKPDAHIRVADALLDKLSSEKNPVVEGFRTIVHALQNWEVIFRKDCNSKDERRKDIANQRLFCCVIELVVEMKVLLWPIIVDQLCPVAEFSKKVFELAQEMRKKTANLKSLYVTSKFFPKQEVLRIIYVNRQSVCALMTKEGVPEMEEYCFESFEDAVRWIDIEKGALMSDVLEEILKSGVSPSDILQDLVPYLYGDECGCWIRALRDGGEIDVNRRIIMVDEPMMLVIPYHQLEHLKKKDAKLENGLTVSVYHIAEGKKLDDATSFGSSAISGDENVFVLVGLKTPSLIRIRKTLLGKKEPQKVGLTAKARTDLSKGSVIGPSLCDPDEPDWKLWFVPYELCVIKGALCLIKVEAKDKLIRGRIDELEARANVKSPVGGGEVGGKVRRGNAPLTGDFYDCLAQEPWTSTEQLRAKPIYVPLEWRKEKGKEQARCLRLWQWFQLAAIHMRVKYVGENVGGLYSHKDPCHSIGNSTANVMHMMGDIDGREFKWEREGNGIKVSGYLPLNGVNDMKFEATYDGIEHRDGRKSGTLTHLTYEEFTADIKNLTAVKVSLAPAPAQQNREKLLICGTWA